MPPSGRPSPATSAGAASGAMITGGPAMVAAVTVPPPNVAGCADTNARSHAEPAAATWALSADALAAQLPVRSMMTIEIVTRLWPAAEGLASSCSARIARAQSTAESAPPVTPSCRRGAALSTSCLRYASGSSQTGELSLYAYETPEGDSPDAKMTTARVETLKAAAIARRSACATGTVRTHRVPAAAPERSAVSSRATPPPPGATEPAGPAECVVEGLCEPLPEAVPDAFSVGDLDAEGVPDGLSVPLPVVLCNCVNVGVAVPLGECVRDALGVRVEVGVRVTVPDGDSVADRVPLLLGVPLTLGLPLLLGVPLSLSLELPLRVPVALPVRVREGVRDRVRVSLSLRVAEPLGVSERDGVPVRVLPCDALADCVLLRVVDGLRVARCEALCDRVADDDGLELGVADALSVPLRDPDTEGVALELPVALELLVGVLLLDIVGLGDGGPLRVCVEDWVRE